MDTQKDNTQPEVSPQTETEANPRKQSESEVQARLKELEQRSIEVKRDREALSKASPWYRQPSNLIGIVAILISTFLAIFTIWSASKEKRLTFSYSPPSSLLFLTPAVKSKSLCTFDGKPVTELGRSVIRLVNAGTEPIDSSDFKDEGPLTIYITKENQTPGDQLPLLLDVVVKDNAGQKAAKLDIISRENRAAFTYQPSLLNPDEIVELEVYTSSVTGLNISIDGKLMGGNLSNLGTARDIPASAVSEVNWSNIINSLNQRLGGKTVTLLILAISFVLLSFLLVALKNSAVVIFYWYEKVAVGINLLFIAVVTLMFIFVIRL